MMVVSEARHIPSSPLKLRPFVASLNVPSVCGLRPAHHKVLPDLRCWGRQYMAGGDLRKALARDVAENGAGVSRGLGWYECGRHILVGVASGLTYLHSQQVGMLVPQHCLVQQCIPVQQSHC